MISDEAYQTGYFGIFDINGIDARTLVFVDGGIEKRYRENYYFDNSKRPGYNGYLLQYTLDGSGIFEKHGVCHEMKKENGFFVKLPEDSRYYLPQECETPWAFLYLHFMGEALAPYVERLEHMSDGIFSVDSSSESIQMFLQFQEDIRRGKTVGHNEGAEFIRCFFRMLLKDIDARERETDISLVKKAVKIMNGNYRELESVQRLAEQLGVTQEYFCRLFKAEMQVSPGQYLTDLRISSAMYDLVNTSENLEVIAQKNGFSNANYFGKVFKKRVGVTPAQYRESE